MQTRLHHQSLVLSAGQIKSLLFTEPMQVRIAHGRVWLTISGMAEDFWMADGDAVDLPAHRQVVIEAHKSDSLLGFVRIEKDVGHENMRPVSALGTPVCAESCNAAP